jgi:1,4-dihydroxy-2-naphthoate octaprenyltransferase
MRGKTWQGVWRLVDPKITLASAVSLFLGACAAAAAGPLHWGWLAVTVGGIFAIEAAKNASGEIYDWDSGDDQAVEPADRSPFSGGKRVLVDGLLSRGETWTVAGIAYAAGIAAGLAIAAVREPRVFWIGIAGVALAFFYHAPPLKLSYRGLGELAVATAYGPLILSGTYLVQRGELPARIVLLSLPLALLIAGFLWVCEFPDEKADRSAGKKTLVVRLGRDRAAKVFAAIVAAAFLGQLALPHAGLPEAVVLGLTGLFPAAAAARRLAAGHDVTARIVDAQKWTLLSFLMLALGGGIGMLL